MLINSFWIPKKPSPWLKGGAFWGTVVEIGERDGFAW